MNIKEIHDKYPHLTVRQLAIMIAISDGFIYTTRIAKLMDMFTSVISRNVFSLEGLSLLTRTEERGEKNCLRFLLKLTPSGKRVINKLGN